MQETDSCGGAWHPFLQSFYHIPPSLRPKHATARILHLRSYCAEQCESGIQCYIICKST
ncbi:hypothetical protein HanPSC8_Chr14g0612321 [Helianthus annuus]|nr:hypothetical protein HanPSC8_Chr14g0612321 [Helianthus annuus]